MGYAEEMANDFARELTDEELAETVSLFWEDGEGAPINYINEALARKIINPDTDPDGVLEVYYTLTSFGESLI